MAFDVGVNVDRTLTALKQEINTAMLAEVEPQVQEALKNIELSMRKALAANLIARLDANISYDRMGYDLRITVAGAFKNGT